MNCIIKHVIFVIAIWLLPEIVIAQTNDDSCIDFSLNIQAKKKEVVLSNPSKEAIDSLLKITGTNPSCKIVISCGNYNNSELGSQISWDILNNVREYLLQQEFNPEKIIFRMGYDEDWHLLIRSVKIGEDGPPILPPPHPGSNPKKSTKIKDYVDMH